MKRILNHIPTRNLAVVAVLLAAVGRAASTQEATGNLEGRVASVDWFVSAALVPVSFVLTGPIAGALGASRTVLGAGVIGGLLLIALIGLRPIRAPERAESAQPAPA